MKNILLVEPNFPIPPKSKNHQNFLPIGLLKIAAYQRSIGNDVKLIRGYPTIDKLCELEEYNPEEIWVSSLFTYWSKYVKDIVHYYKSMFPKAWIKVGGIYASLYPSDEVIEYVGCDEIIKGVIPEAEKFEPAYDLLSDINENPIDYQIIHTSRGCERKCAFCGTWIIEPEFISEKTIKDKIKYKKIVFYDNNLLMNPYIEDIFKELIELKKKHKISWCESQSGLDGRILIKNPHLAKMMKQAGFRYPRIAWDWKYDRYTDIKKQLDLLIEAGYHSKDIYIFVLYNWNISFEEMELKRKKCWEWKVQIADCRYRPLSQLYDNYKSNKVGQTLNDYHIHEDYGWTDGKVKLFRRNVRRQNICVRHNFPIYSKAFEHKMFGKEIILNVRRLNSLEDQIEYMKKNNADYWLPEQN